MKRVTRIIDSISDWTGIIFSYLVVPITLLTVFEVITRRVFNDPHDWTFETTAFMYGAHFMLVAAYGLLYNAHVRITIISDRFSPRVGAILDLICYFVLFLPFIILVLIYGIDFAATSWVQKETSWSAWGPPVYPIKTVIPLTAVLLLLQGISDIIKRLAIVTKGVQL